jgi:hypothetical protein
MLRQHFLMPRCTIRELRKKSGFDDPLMMVVQDDAGQTVLSLSFFLAPKSSLVAKLFTGERDAALLFSKIRFINKADCEHYRDDRGRREPHAQHLFVGL